MTQPQNLSSSEYTESLRAALEHARAAHPELAALLDQYGEILAAQHAVQEALPANDSISDLNRLAEGKPALTFDDLAVDWGLFARLWQQCDDIARRDSGDTTRESTPIAWREMARDWFAGTTPRDEHLDLYMSTALHPFLARAAESIAPRVQPDLWTRGACQVCGGEPDLAFLDADNARHLVCARCDATWIFIRICCPFCENNDPDRLSYFPSDDEVYRLYVCEACKHYLKAIDLRRARHRVAWGVERIATAGMDAAAVRAGYKQTSRTQPP